MATDLVTLGASLVTFCLGHILGNRAAIGRDKRKEWNEKTERIYEALRLVISSKGRTNGPHHGDFERVVPYMSWWQRRQFPGRIERYKSALSKFHRPTESLGGFGELTCNPDYQDEVTEAATELRKLFKPR